LGTVRLGAIHNQASDHREVAMKARLDNIRC